MFRRRSKVRRITKDDSSSSFAVYRENAETHIGVSGHGTLADQTTVGDTHRRETATADVADIATQNTPAPEDTVADETTTNSTIVADETLPTTPLPMDLIRCGNADCWRKLGGYLSDSTWPPDPILMCGGVGYGKTYGIAKLAEHLSLTVVALDASDTLCRIREYIHLSRHRARRFCGRVLLLIDDIDGFPTDAISIITGVLSTPTQHASRGTAVIATCVNPWALNIRSLRTWSRVVLKSVPTHSMMRIASEWRTEPSAAGVCDDDYNAAVRCAGDLRQLYIYVRWGFSSRADRYHTIFQAAERLLTRKCTCEDVLTCSDVDGVISVLTHNYLTIFHDDGLLNGKLNDFTDIISIQETLPANIAHYLMICGFRGHLHTRRCPPLHLPKSRRDHRAVDVDNPMQHLVFE